MNLFGLSSWDDAFLWHYVGAVLTSFIGILVTFLFCLKSKHGEINLKKASKTGETVLGDVHEDSDHDQVSTYEDSEDFGPECTQQSSDEGDDVKNIKNLKRPLKISPALMAEHVIKANMTEEQRNLEQEVCHKQLSEIFQLMQKENDKFGEISLSEVKEQMKLYH